MYLPRQEKKVRQNPFKVQYSIRFLYASGFVVVLATVSSLIYAMQQVQQRERRAQRELRQQRPGQRVVIVGAGPGGTALAASLCNSTPDLHVTVIEKERKQTFMGAYPLAHVGHRSYDLNTSGGIDFLRSPASWNVTRDAHLVSGRVVKVLTDSQEVVVAPLEGAAAAFTSKGSSKDEERASNNTSSTSWLRRVIPFLSTGAGNGEAEGQAAKPSAQQPFRHLDGGLQAYPYDVLVVACGAKRTLGPLESILPHGLADIDCYGIAVNPGVTRDTLAHLFGGNVVHVKVPPKSFCALMEAERKGRPPAEVLLDGGSVGAAGQAEESAFEAVSARLSGLTDTAKPAAATTGGAEGLDSGDRDSPSAAPLHPYMFATSRQHDSTFVSTTNTIWKYLDFFKKFSYCHLISISADAEPLGPAPVEVNAVVTSFWKARREGSRQSLHTGHANGDGKGPRTAADTLSSDGGGYVVQAPGSHEKTIMVRLPEESAAHNVPSRSANEPPALSTVAPRAAVDGEEQAQARPAHFHFLNNSYLTAVQPDRQLVTVYNHAHNVLLTLPYRLLLLDLPLTVPAFVRESGLARGDRYARENAPETLQSTGRDYFRRGGDAKAAVPRHVRRAFEDEAAFVDVDPATLQHRRFNNVFAIGDVAGLPAVKGYGATFAQVPVVAHNVKQVLYNQRAAKRIAAEEAQYKAELAAYEAEQRHRKRATLLGGLRALLGGSSEPAGALRDTDAASVKERAVVDAPPEKPSTSWFRPRCANARYDGYSSYPVIMTTWRAMWPEMVNASASPPHAGGPDLSRRMQYCDNHLWNNLAWWDARGFANAAYCQTTLYESMYFFLFNRGVWYPPRWFQVPSFSAADGTMEQTRRGWLGFL